MLGGSGDDDDDKNGDDLLDGNDGDIWNFDDDPEGK